MIDLHDELRRITRKISEQEIEYALCGGLAMAVYGQPRATVDIDFLLRPEALDRFRAAVATLGYTFEARPMDFRSGLRIHRFTKIDGGDFLSIDVLLTYPQIEEVWRERRTIEWSDGKLTVVSREGLITLKEQRKSGQDLDDIAWLKNEK